MPPRLPPLHSPAFVKARRLARLAHAAIVFEASTAIKPGLVCPESNGAHSDMDFRLLLVSAKSLLPYFHQAALQGARDASLPPAAAFAALRRLGVQAEAAMMRATGGVNTHKGQIFSLGLLTAAAARLRTLNLPRAAEHTCAAAAAFVRGMVDRELAALHRAPPDRPLSAGEQLYLRYGATGARGEAESGFPAALRILPGLRAGSPGGKPPRMRNPVFQQALTEALLELIRGTCDTNLLWRGGMEGLRLVQAGARAALEQGGMRSAEGRKAVQELELLCVQKRLSPGGAADLLAVALYLLLLEKNEISGKH